MTMARGGVRRGAARRRLYSILAVVAGSLAVVGGLWLWIGMPSPPLIADATPAVAAPAAGVAAARRETRPTLDPAKFVGKARIAHQVAREIPDVLDQLYCYCECDKHRGHKSLLSCYTDGHAAT
jgi:hypothetical protein